MELIYSNGRGLAVTMGTARSVDAPCILSAAEGLYDLQSDIYSVPSALDAGNMYVSSRVKPRVITLEGWIPYNVPANRRRLTACVSPLERGWLTVRRDEPGGVFERRIACVVQDGPRFGREDASQFTITLMAPSPWWEESGGDRQINLTGWQGYVSFPLSIAENWAFGGRSPDVTVNAFNPGDVPSGMIIRMYASDTALSPEISRPGTDERLLITGALERGEAIEVCTIPGGKYAKRILTDGRTVNGMRWIDPLSSFIQLRPGDNLLKAAAQSGAASLSVTLAFRARYITV